MGTWGVGIYSNDIGADVQTILQEISPFLTIKECCTVLFEEYQELLSCGIIDNEVASFWYALADWQWRHGVLENDVKEYTLSLLTEYAGIADWEEFASPQTVKKRRKVLDKLRDRLHSPLPSVKLPKGNLKKPKHMPGDIIVVKTSNIEDNNEMWICNCGKMPFMYTSPSIRNSSVEFSPPLVANNCYMAFLCIGTEKKQYSEYVPSINDEVSVYVVYDYCDTQKPSLDDLKKCGFLPSITHSYNYEERKIENIEWSYSFTTDSHFRSGSIAGIDALFVYKSTQEVTRFLTLLSLKSYSNKTLWGLDLYHIFALFFEEKTRLGILNIDIDNLLDPSIINPALLEEIDDSSL